MLRMRSYLTPRSLSGALGHNQALMSFEYRVIPSWFGPIRIRVPDDPDFDRQTPRGKVRGRRRRYRALHRDASRFTVRPEGWYDFMHWHVDWDGLGNLRWRERREHLAALFVMFKRLRSETADWSTPHQIWLQIDAFDGSQDAVYLHTPNPNRANFPATFPGVVWDAEVSRAAAGVHD